MKRGLMIGGVIVVFVLIAAGVGTWYLFSNLDSIVKAAVEKVGSDVTGTQVTLDNVEIALTSGRGSLLGFRMTNPSGFEADEAFKFDEVTVVVDTASVTSDPVVIKEILIAKPDVTYEIGNSGTNLDAIQSNVTSNSASTSSGGEPAGGEGKAPNFIIENLYLRGGKVNVLATQFPDNKMSAPLPEIHLKDIGKDQGGATPGEITQQVMDQLLADISGAVSQIDISGITKNLGESAKKALESVDTKAIEEGAGSLGESTGGAVEGASDAVKKLLGSGD
jgi:hypothetical protein